VAERGAPAEGPAFLRALFDQSTIFGRWSKSRRQVWGPIFPSTASRLERWKPFTDRTVLRL
jgi:hypothetical protein